jgi:hypothetical protein
MFYHCSEDKKLEHVRNWLKRPPRALPKCYLDWVKQLPEDEKQTLRDLRKETTRRFNEGFLSQDNAGKNSTLIFKSSSFIIFSYVIIISPVSKSIFSSTL